MEEMTTPLFTLAQAKAHGLRKDQVYQLLSEGRIERVGLGVFMESGSLDPSLIALAAVAAIKPEATLCLTSALAYHELTDAIPYGSDIALPRGTRFPAGISHIILHNFDRNTFNIGCVELPNDAGLPLQIYSAERCIIDMFRLSHLEGQDAAIAVLKRWLAKTGSSAGVLLEMAQHFPKAEPSLRRTLEVLL